MRTVHETEALRPSDPVPRNYNSSHFKPQRLKLTLKPPPAVAGEKTDVDSNATLSPPPTDGAATIPDEDSPALDFEDTSDDMFTKEELAMPADKLFSLLRRQLAWSEEEGERLKAEVEEAETKRWKEWQAKELVLTNLMEAELATAHSKGEDAIKVIRIVHEDLPGEPLPLKGFPQPWYRRVDEAGDIVDDEQMVEG